MKVSVIKRAIPVAMLSLALVMTGCSSKDDPNAGVYKAVSATAFGMEMSADEVFEDDVIIELKGNGKADFKYEGDSYSMKWELDGKKFHAEGGGAELDGNLEDGVMELEDLLSSGVDLILECEDLVKSSSKDKKDKDDDDKEESKETKAEVAEETTEAAASYDTSLIGDYDAVASRTAAGEDWLIEGDYLKINEDGTIQIGVEDQVIDFDTEIRDNKFYTDGDTKVGVINSDGTIELDLNDEVTYIYAREGMTKWADWQAALDEFMSNKSADGGDISADELSAFEADYIGFIRLGEGLGSYEDIELDGITTYAFGRVVTGEDGTPSVYFRICFPDDLNFTGTTGKFSEFEGDTWLDVTGDIKGVQWYDSALAPSNSEGGALYIWGSSAADDSDLFDMYLWPLDAEWDRAAVGDLISDEDYEEFHTVAAETAGQTLEERMETVQNILNEDGEVIHLFTDELPKAG